MSITLRETLTKVSYYTTLGDEITVNMPDDDRENESEDAAVLLQGGDVHPDLVMAVLRYGVKQILADAAAAPRGTSDSIRMERMARRADSLRNGTWGLKPARQMPDEPTFLAMLAHKGLENNESSRAKWLTLSKKQRQAIAVLPEIAALLPKSNESDALLAMFHVEPPENPD